MRSKSSRVVFGLVLIATGVAYAEYAWPKMAHLGWLQPTWIIPPALILCGIALGISAFWKRRGPKDPANDV